MTDDKKKHDDKDRKKLSDEEMEDVAGGRLDVNGHLKSGPKGQKKDDGNHRDDNSPTFVFSG